MTICLNCRRPHPDDWPLCKDCDGMQDATTATPRALGLHRKAIRVRVDLTAAEVATRAGLSTAAVSAAEAGSSVSEKTIRKIAKVLGVTPAEYIGPELAS